MRPKTWLIAFSLFVTACASLPERPKGELCTIDIERSQLICASISKVESLEELKEIHTTVDAKTSRVIPLIEADKFIAFSPDTWINVQTYIDELRALAERSCQ